MYFLIFERSWGKIYVTYCKGSNVFRIQNGHWIREPPKNYTGVPIPNNVVSLFADQPLRSNIPAITGIQNHA